MNRLLLLVLTALLAAPAWGQDLSFQVEPSAEYVRYLRNTDATLTAQITPEDTPASANARAARALVQIALIHTTTDSLVGELVPLFEDETELLETIYRRDFEGLDFDDPEALVRQLLDLTAGERYRTLEADASRLADGFDEHAGEAEKLATDWSDGLVRHAETFAEDMEALAEGSAPFSVSFAVEGSGAGTLVFDRAAIDGVLQAAEDLQTAANELTYTLEEIAALADGQTSSAAAIAQIRTLLASIETSADAIDATLTAQPLSVFDLTIASERRELSSAFDGIRDVLDGRTYDLGDGVTVRPVAFLEQLDSGYYPLVLDFFRQPASSRSAYTWGNLFPAGLPSDVTDLLGVDATLSVAAGADDLRARVQTLEVGFRDRLATGATFDAHAGLALALSFQMFDDHAGSVEDAVELLARGDFETLLDRYGDDAADAADRADEIAEQFQQALDAADGYDAFVFTLRVDEGGDPNAVSDGDFVPLIVTTGMIQAFAATVDELARTTDEVVAEVSYLLEEADTGFDLYLDPNALDFSKADTPFRFVVALQRANPDFLVLKPLGRDRMLEAGDAIREVMPDLSQAARDVINAVRDAAVLETVLDDDHADLLALLDDAESYVDAMRDDFLIPSAATEIDGEAVNLSAWFDTPPVRLLDAARLFFDGDDRTDNTFAGLFPNRTVSVDGIGEASAALGVTSVAPHPVRGQARIGFVIGTAGSVGADVFDVLGRRVASVDSRPFGAGEHTLALPTDALPAGTYLLRLHAGDATTTHALVVAR